MAAAFGLATHYAVTPVFSKEDSNMYGLIGNIEAQAGKGPDLAAILMEGSRGMSGNVHYLVSLDAENPDSLWVYEVWESEAAHKASLQSESVQAAIAKGRPLIAGFSLSKPVRPVE